MKINGQEFLIGADPELFIKDKQTGKFVSAHGMLPGTKEKPYKVKYGAIQVDGMAAEFNIDPAKTKSQFIRNVTCVVKQIEDYLGDRYELVATPTCHFGKEFIDAQPLESRILGCDPDFDAYTGKSNPIPDVERPFRTGAGHIHIGWTEGQDVGNPDHLEVCKHLVRNLDYYTIPTLAIDTDITRRELYGNAGAFRPKPYGVEYRTPSNFWVSSPKTMSMMYDLVKLTLRNLTSLNDTPSQEFQREYGNLSVRNEMRARYLNKSSIFSDEKIIQGIHKELGGRYV